MEPGVQQIGGHSLSHPEAPAAKWEDCELAQPLSHCNIQPDGETLIASVWYRPASWTLARKGLGNPHSWWRKCTRRKVANRSQLPKRLTKDGVHVHSPRGEDDDASAYPHEHANKPWWNMIQHMPQQLVTLNPKPLDETCTLEVVALSNPTNPNFENW